MPKSLMAPPEVARRGPHSRKQRKPKISKPPNAVGANGVAHGSGLHNGRNGGRGRPGAESTPARRRGGGPGKLSRAGTPKGDNPAAKSNGKLRSSIAAPDTTSTNKATECDARRNGRPTAPATHPDLVTMVEQLKESHRMCMLLARTTEERARQSIEAAKQAGDLLIQIKSQIEHGNWEKWLKTQCGISPRTARDYMNVAENWTIIEPLIDPKRRPAAVLNLTIKSILRYLAKPRADRDTAKATAENTADAAGADDRPNRSESAEARGEDDHEDANRRRNEDSADGQRAERADRRTSSDKQAESAQDDDEATAQDPDATTVTEEQLDDQQWLSNRKIRQKLADPTAFDREAILWRHTWPEVALMIRRIDARMPGLLEEVAEKGSPYCWYARQLAEITNFPHPDSWKVCSLCKGKGHKGREKEPCLMCAAAGYNYTNWLRTH